jgi:hypothetical protein
MFGMPAEGVAARDDMMLGSNIVTVPHHRPDVETLRAPSTRIVFAVCAVSGGKRAHRGGEAVAEVLGTSPLTFPGDHAGFLSGEYGQKGEPVAEVLGTSPLTFPGDHAGFLSGEYGQFVAQKGPTGGGALSSEGLDEMLTNVIRAGC